MDTWFLSNSLPPSPSLTIFMYSFWSLEWYIFASFFLIPNLSKKRRKKWFRWNILPNRNTAAHVKKPGEIYSENGVRLRRPASEWGSVCIQGSNATQEACFQLTKEASCKMPEQHDHNYINLSNCASDASLESRIPLPLNTHDSTWCGVSKWKTKQHSGAPKMCQMWNYGLHPAG